MHVQHFEIKNFKGVKHSKISVPEPGSNSIVCLIGLNESGKTSILEALSTFISTDDSLSVLFSSPDESSKVSEETKSTLYDYVPKNKKANFSDEISVRAHISLTTNEVNDIAVTILEEEGITLDESSFPTEFTVEKYHQFASSKYVKSGTYWSCEFKGKRKRQRKYWKITSNENRDVWLKIIAKIRDQLPRICFFPTFLFDFPDRIYLVDHTKETAQNTIYRKVLQDVLDSEGTGLEIIDHLVSRIANTTETSASFDWLTAWTKFLRKDEKEQVNAVLQRMSAHISERVFTAWDDVFGERFQNKRIAVELEIDEDMGNIPYLEFVILDGGTRYKLKDRSLGFRWFFSFLLFTEFRAARKVQTSTIFLFDEPASNLHAKAQMQLMRGLPNVAKGNASIIYSTHSLYLIAPEYLENSYVIDNSALNPDASLESEFVERPNDIEAVKYPTFVGQNPDRGSYFQPVIDRLNGIASPIQLPDDVIIMEGKTDFYFMSYFVKKYNISGISIFPSAGASTADVLISLALGFGKNFRVLTDDDDAGRRAAESYKKRFFISDKVGTFADIHPDYINFKLESFFSTQTKQDIKTRYSITSIKKRHTAMFFSEQNNLLEHELDTETLASVSLLFTRLKNWISK